jgi:hypothetical protein
MSQESQVEKTIRHTEVQAGANMGPREGSEGLQCQEIVPRKRLERPASTSQPESPLKGNGMIERPDICLIV